MRRVMFVVLSAAVVAIGTSAAAQQTAAPARATTPPATQQPAPAAPVAAPAAGFGFAPAVAPAPGQDVTPPPTPPQRGGRGQAQGVPGGQQGGRGRSSANGTPSAPAPAMGRGGFGYSPSMENVKVEVVLSDTITQSGNKKTVSMVITNNRKGQIRSSGNAGGYTLNVDAQPQLLSDGRILVALELLYLPEATGETKPVAIINESLSVIVNNGTAMLISQSADPRSDRKVTVELTASTQK